MTDALVGNAASKSQVKKAKKKEDYLREDEIEDMRIVLSTPSGRRTIWRYLSLCGMFKHGFETDARFETFLSGQRNIGSRIMVDIQDVDPGLFGALMKEMSKDKGVTND